LSSLIITGGYPVSGEVQVQGSKNAVLPLLAASLLVKGTTVIEHCPDISDVTCMLEILKSLGCTVLRDKETVIIDAEILGRSAVSRQNAEKMRSSISLLGALLGREGRARIPLPGGCSIGKRPVDLHLMALRCLGAEIEEKDELYAVLRKCHSAEIVFPYPSVGAVQNVILASVVSSASIVMRNCAREPEVEELCMFLNRAGANIRGGGTDTIIVTGVKKLCEIRYIVRSDRIVAGTLLSMAAATQGDITVKGIDPFELSAVTNVFANMGCQVKLYTDAISLKADGRVRCLPLLKTLPYPGFPTDMQSQLISVLIQARGTSVVRETVFENRLGIVPELRRMHADIVVNRREQAAIIRGRDKRYLHAAELMAPDLRAGAALVVAAMAVEGTSTIKKSEYVERGYENMAQLVRSVGGSCQVLSE